MRRRNGLWIGGLLFAFLFGLIVSKPPVSSAALHEDFAHHPSADILVGEREDASAAPSDKDCWDVSSNASAQDVGGSPAMTHEHPKGAACAPTP